MLITYFTKFTFQQKLIWALTPEPFFSGGGGGSLKFSNAPKIHSTIVMLELLYIKESGRCVFMYECVERSVRNLLVVNNNFAARGFM